MTDADQDDELDLGASADLIATIKREFKGVDRPVTAEELARLYGVIAAMHEANLACFAVAMQAKPEMAFTDQSVVAQKAIDASVGVLADALRELAAASMSEDDRAKFEAQNDD